MITDPVFWTIFAVAAALAALWKAIRLERRVDQLEGRQ